MRDDDVLSGWAAIVDRIVRGEPLPRQSVVVGPTPEILQRFGLSGHSLSMSVAKVARCRREHPEVPLDVWHRLPTLLEKPLAIFPSKRRDRSIVVLLVVLDRNGDPVLVAATPDSGDGPNAILSVYGKEAGLGWVAHELEEARRDGLPTYESNDFAASMPQPPVAEATSSSHGPIPSDGTAKSARELLRISQKVKDEG